jgi:ABC-2 type transport system ATP-binding protein
MKSAAPQNDAIWAHAVIEVEHLTKDYGTVVALRDVSFRVGKGEVVGFLGPNGAGKSTTMRILVGFLGATSGRVKIDGHDIAEDSLAARGSMGYMPEAAPLYPEMRVREYLGFRAAVKKVPRAERKSAVDRSMRQAAVTEMADTLIGHLSKGYRQRVGLADALVSNPPLLILDEPTAGLDPNQIREVRKLIRNLGESHTILLSTHILSEVESTCDRALVIDRGRLVAEGSLSELRARRGAEGATIVVRLRDQNEKQAKSLLEKIEGVRRVRSSEREDDVVRFTLGFEKKNHDAAALLERAIADLVGAGFGVREAAPVRATLEDVFAELTRAEQLEAQGAEESE